MGVRRVNLLDCELLDPSEEEWFAAGAAAGFAHSGRPIGPLLQSVRLHAGLYEAHAGHPTWPYHCHRSTEELRCVLTGTPGGS